MNASALTTASATTAATSIDTYRRRAERRVAHRVPCRVRVLNSSTGRVVSVVGQTVNLSVSGLAVQLGCAMVAGTHLEVLLPQLDGEPMRLHGRVVHCRRVLTGTFEVGVWVELESEQI
jgi:hypothetical protein